MLIRPARQRIWRWPGRRSNWANRRCSELRDRHLGSLLMKAAKRRKSQSPQHLKESVSPCEMPNRKSSWRGSLMVASRRRGEKRQPANMVCNDVTREAISVRGSAGLCPARIDRRPFSPGWWAEMGLGASGLGTCLRHVGGIDGEDG